MSDLYNEIETDLKKQYEEFITTKSGKEWKKSWENNIGSDIAGDFGDYLYDFYPEMLQ